jgi:hypothetical protein
MKIKCIKLQCPICSKDGNCQVFFNKQNEIRYGRVRHYIPKEAKEYNRDNKYNFSYCKLEDLQQLETLLKTLDFPFPATETQTENSGHIGQDLKPDQHEIGQADSRLIFRTEGAGSSVRIEHHPPKVGVVGSNPTPPAGLVKDTIQMNIFDHPRLVNIHHGL